MFRMIQNLQAKRRSETGASAVEYGLLVALIAAVIVVAVLLLGGVVRGAFTDTSSGIRDGVEGDATTAACAPAE